MDNFMGRMEKLWSLLEYVKSINITDNRTPLERFIDSKSLASVGDIEYWTRVYEQAVSRSVELG
jgi:hypothetical protein